ncbi:MAG: hypothetical protein ACJ78Q_16350 [Chloroflexia bacterium]
MGIAELAGESLKALAPLDGVASLPMLAFSGIVVGSIVGLPQGLVLWSYVRIGGAMEWVLATILGRAARWILAALIIDLLAAIEFRGALGFCLSLVIPVLVGGSLGAVVGIPQARVLKRRVQNAGWWVWANVTSSALYLVGFIFGEGIVSWLHPFDTWIIPASIFESIFGGLVAGALTGAITGYALIDLLRHPRSEAEWRVGWKQAQKGRKLESEVAQPSPEALLEQIRSRD